MNNIGETKEETCKHWTNTRKTIQRRTESSNCRAALVKVIESFADGRRSLVKRVYEAR